MEIYSRTISADSTDSLWLISELIKPSSKVLDIGAGSGALGEYLSTKKHCRIDGIEKDPQLAGKAIAKYRRFHVLDVDTSILVDVISDDRYEFIVLADVLEHLREPGEILKQIPSLMSEGGHLLLSVPNIGHAGVIAGLLSGQFHYRDEGLLDATHVRFFTRSSLCELLENHGFEILSINPLLKDIRETEFKDHFLDACAPALVRTLLAQPDALTYQFIVDAVYNPAHRTVAKKAGYQKNTKINQIFFGCQLFWKSKQDNYSAIQSINAAGVIGKVCQNICFKFPHLDIPPEKLRLDLSDRPGVMNLYNMRLTAVNGDVLWEWQGDMAYLTTLKSVDIEFFSQHSMLLTGEDSQIELDIPKDSLRKLTSGASFVVELGWPMNADFAAALDGLSEVNYRHPEENAPPKEAEKHPKLRGLQLETEIVDLRMTSKEQTQTINRLRDQLNEASLVISSLEKARQVMETSFSWQMTVPVRLLGRWLRRMRDSGNSILSKCNHSRDPSSSNTLTKSLTGNLDSPNTESVLRQNIFSVSGWIFASASPVSKVYAIIDNSVAQPLTYGYERLDVHQVYPNDSGSFRSGFSGIVTFQSKFLSNINLAIWVELQDGTKVKCFAKALRYSRLSISELQLPLMLAFLRVSIRKAWDAFRAGRLPMSPTAWWLGLRRNYFWMIGANRNYLKSAFFEHLSLAQDPYQQWILNNSITPKLQLLMKADAQSLSIDAGAKISIVAPVYNTSHHFLEEMIESVIAQFYGNWELILVDDASTLEHVRATLQSVSKKDHRIRAVFRATNGHISEATNDGINEATGEFVALLDHDDTLPADALLHVAECISLHPDVDWIYTDEDKIDEFGRRFDPQFKGAWNPEMAITHNYTHHLTVIRKELIHQVGGMRKGYEGAQDLDLFLRVAEITVPAKVRHIPRICYHWRSHEGSTASQGTQKTYVFDSAERAIQDALIRRNISAEPFLPAISHKYGLCLNQLRWKNGLGPGREVTVVIPTKDRVDLLKRCISSLCETVDMRFVKLIVMDDRSNKEETLNYLTGLEANSLFQCQVVRPKRGDITFNYARLINEAVEYVDTPYFLQLNNDVEAMDHGWLEDMMGWLSIDGVGVVGARLLYPDHTIQHAGVVIGPHGGLADHQFHQLPSDDVGYLVLPHAARAVSAVTGACLLTSTELYKNLGGFDELNFAVEYNDVDFCLRVIESGKRIVYTPQATLVHLTSATRGKYYNPDEHINFVKKYKHFQDVFYSRSIRLDSMWMPIDGSYYSHADRVKDISILFFVHELSLTGAPIVAYEFARNFSSFMGFNVTIVALQDGPVRHMYEEIGIPVIVLSEIPNMLHMSADKFQHTLYEIGNLLHGVENYDLVICNTLTTFWGVLLADIFKLPSIWHIHESVGVERYAAMFADLAVRDMVASSFLKANRIIFQANATRTMYSEFESLGHFQTIPGGLPLARIEAFRAANSKSELRKKYDISEDANIVVLIGTTCERKGQAVFLDAIKEMEAKFSEALPDNLMFLLVGAVEGPYLEMLRDTIMRYKLKNVHLVYETKDIYDYYALCDAFVCASYEESFPMVVLLAMAFELPIVSTNVFGIPEIVTDQQEAFLIPPGDPQSMANLLHRCLIDNAESVAMARRAHAKVYRLFDSEVLHAKHVELARKVAMEDNRATIH